MVADPPTSVHPSASVAVVLDSNAMWNQWWLDGRSWDELRDLVEQQRIALYVPEVVVQEVVRGRRHDAHDLVRELDKINLARIERLLDLGLPKDRKKLTRRVKELVANYETELRTRLGELRAVITPIPAVSHQEVLTRAMERRRPFDAEGRNGYRDVLIWHSLLDVVKRGYAGIVFVTDNKGDFCTGKPPALLPALADELATVSRQAVAVVASSVAEAVGSRVAEVEDRIAPETDAEEVPNFERPSDVDILAALSACVDVIVAGVEPPTPGRWGADLAYMEWQFNSILEEDPVDVVSIDLHNATLVCEEDLGNWAEFAAKVEAEVTLDGFAYKADFYGEDRIAVEVQDSDWNDHYMWVYEYHKAELTFCLVLNDEGTIDECWLEGATEKLNVDDIESEGIRFPTGKGKSP